MGIYRRDKLFERAREMSSYFLDSMFSLQNLPAVTDIRGYGMLVGFDVAPDGAPVFTDVARLGPADAKRVLLLN